MKCKGEFVFKTITYREGGKFKTEEGEEKEYKPAYIVKVDENLENGQINERKFKVSEDKIVLINTLKELKAYTTIELIFNVIMYTSSVSLELVDVEVYKNEEDY